MTDISLCFEVHQPLRLRKDLFWGGSLHKRVASGDLLDLYFDCEENRRIFQRVAAKCYLPANAVIGEEIRRFAESERPFKVAYSFSGTFLDQCSKFQPEVLASFQDLVGTGMVEILEQTYYHSLSSLYKEKGEFEEQVKMHRELVWDLFGQRPTFFENTELLYDDRIASMVASMGYKGIFTEGVVADPGFVYRPRGSDLSLLLRNYQLTDDVGFRFSARWWSEYPLTADKYSSWLARTPGQCINLFCDYETFGEHQWEETGIFHFLRYLPREINRWPHLAFATPSEIVEKHPAHRDISVPRTVSWADLERDTSCWLGNALQWACFLYQQRLEGPIKDSGDAELLSIWRSLCMSDHLYYLFTRGGGPGEVHSYFSPYESAYDAAVTYFSALSDLEFRLRQRLTLADHPFRFSEGPDQFTGEVAWSLESMVRAISKIDIEILEGHMVRGDLARWAKDSLGDADLAAGIADLTGLEGQRLRKALLRRMDERLDRGG